MKITVILCTYNRCESLKKALNSVAVSILPESIQWEVLVVDNNSSDQTRTVVEEFSQRHPGRFRYLFEPQQGKSYALNAGIQDAKGDVLAFTDDDVIVEPTWLRNLTTGLCNNGCNGVGGRVLPERTFTPPPWLSMDERYSLGPLGLFDLGPSPCELTEPPFGNNMAFRKEAFSKYGRFRTDLGPRPSNEIRSEDTEFGSRLLAAGERLRYEPSAVVYHSVPEKRVQKSYFLNWWFDKARADLREFGIPSGTRWYFKGVPLYLFRRLVRWTLSWLVTVEPSLRFSRKFYVWGCLGSILESYQQSKNSTIAKK